MSSLHPPNTEIALELGIQQYECQDAVAHHLASKGFAAPPIPYIQTTAGAQPYGGTMPHDIINLTDTELGTLLNQLAAWHDYTQFQLAEAHMNQTKAQEELDFTEAKIRLTYTHDGEGKKLTVGERQDRVKVDSRYVAARSRQIYYETVYTYTRAIERSADRNWQTVSRRITQRGQDLERDRRNLGVQNQSITTPMFGRRP